MCNLAQWPAYIVPIAMTLELLSNYYSRLCWRMPAGRLFYFAHFLFLFLFNESPQKRPNAVWRQIWQDVGPDSE